MKAFFLTFAVLLLMGFLWMFITSTGSPKWLSAKYTCLSNTKQYAMAAILYSSDYDDRLPNRDDWMDTIQPYGNRANTAVCPEVYKLNHQFYGLCFNARLSNAKIPKYAANAPLIFDSVNLSRNASGGLDSLPNPGRHKGTNNIAYADGHAKPVRNP